MKNLRNRFERFCYRNRTKGIPNLMLYVTLGSALVYVMSKIDHSNALLSLLYFNRNAILQGQVWRLFTFVFAYASASANFLLVAISLLCYFSLGRAIENAWGTLRFNLFYFAGIILMDAYAMIFNTPVSVTYLNLSLFLAYSTLYPDAHFLLFFIIPVRAWIFALIDLVLTFYDVFKLAIDGYYLHSLFPLVAIANYFLFFGKDVLNVIPMSWRVNARRLFKKKPKATKATGTIPFSGSYQASTASVKAPYTHRCVICGRTDVSHPDLEFRYCSRCNGYHCYCEDHISNHQHIE